MGLRRSAVVISNTSGVNISTMVSFKKIAESTPETTMKSASKARGLRAQRITWLVTSWKKPASRRLTLMTIMANNNVRVFRSRAA